MAATVPVVAGALASALPMIASWLPDLRFVSAIAGMGGQATVPGVTVAASAALAFLLLAFTGLSTRAEN